MTITTVHSGITATRAPVGPRPGSAHRFSTILAAQSRPAIAASQESVKEQIADTAGIDGASGKVLPISLGTISDSSPSVSHLLINHPDLQDQCWKIIFSPINQGKPFTSMHPGVEVFLDPATKEISWQETPPQPVSVAARGEFDSHEKHGNSALVNIGTINSEQPTLSHLLKNHPDYGDKTWDIIFSAENRNKPYATLQPGVNVFIDPNTLELSFHQGVTPNVISTPFTNNTPSTEAVSASAQTITDSNGFAKKFAESVKTYLGRPYQKIDCYGLVVRGLEDLGVHYKGADGLRQHLVQMASDKGLRHNAYHNGEGLIEVAGNKLFDESFTVINNAEQQAHEVMRRIEPLLQEGVLLSFSTPSRGHTGVISQKNGEWTYVNSGVIDHQVDGGRATKRVGEETLEEEVTNWFKLAKNDKTSLKVSAGIFDTEKLKNKARLAINHPSGERDVI